MNTLIYVSVNKYFYKMIIYLYNIKQCKDKIKSFRISIIHVTSSDLLVYSIKLEHLISNSLIGFYKCWPGFKGNTLKTYDIGIFMREIIKDKILKLEFQ